jgi:dCTP deaminase
MRPQGTVLVDKQLRNLMAEPRPSIIADPSDVGSCSLDLRVGERIWQVAGLPSLAKGFNSQEFIKHYSLNDFSNSDKLILTKGSTYLAELTVNFELLRSLHGYVNPKSSSGRIDFHCITLAEGCNEFYVVPEGYQGKLYMIMVPQSFNISEVRNQDFVQVRIFDGPRRVLWGHELNSLHHKFQIVDNVEPVIMDDGLILHLDLRNFEPKNLVALRSGKPFSVKSRGIEPKFYFHEKGLDSTGNLFLEPGEFMLASTIERIRVPPHVCVEMLPYREQQGEIRSHYAGFFDPGFGYGQAGEAESATVVFEIRNITTVPIILSHGQAVALCKYEYLFDKPESAYGVGKPGAKVSNYQSQSGVKLAKYFRPWTRIDTPVSVLQ